MMRYFFVFAAVLTSFLLGCSHPENNHPDKDVVRYRTASKNPEERAKLAPNPVFEAIMEGRDAQMQEAITNKSSWLYEVNQEGGDRPLGLAIRMRYFDLASELINQMPATDLTFQNNKGESYVYLASKAGALDLVLQMADKYFASRGRLHDFIFSDIDLKNNAGERALHVAADRRMAALLEEQYNKSIVMPTFYRFTFLADAKGRNFIHAAANDSRVDVIRWAVEKYCGRSSWETEGLSIVTYPTAFVMQAGRLYQTHIGDFGWFGWEKKFNWQDADGNTPLHLAARAGNSEAVRVIGGCEWTDFALANNEGNLALHSFLKSIDPLDSNVSEDKKNAFRFLSGKQTRLRKYVRTPSDYVDHKNKMGGQTALHLAAGLSDPFFYEALRTTGNQELPNAEGLRPIDIFENRQSQLRAQR